MLADISDTGPSPDIATMAHDADVQLTGATIPERVLPAGDTPYLSTARKADEHAFPADLDIANPGMIIKLG